MVIPASQNQDHAAVAIDEIRYLSDYSSAGCSPPLNQRWHLVAKLICLSEERSRESGLEMVIPGSH